MPAVMRAAVAIALVPAVAAHGYTPSANTQDSLPLQCIGQLAIGASFGLSASLVAAGAAAAGSLIDATLAVQAFGGEPVFGAADGPFSRTFALAFGWCFLASGALTHLCARFVAASSVVPAASLAANAVTLVRASIEASLTLAAPAIAGQLLSTLIAAAAARAAPRINGLMLSAPIATSVVLLIALAGAGRTLEALLRLATTAAMVKPV